jgi:hypothetical protein
MPKLFLFCGLIFAGLFGLQTFFPAWLHPLVWQAAVFVVLMTLAGHYAIEVFSRKAKDNLGLVFLGTMTFRLIASSVFFAAFAFSHTLQILLLAANFVVLYIFCTGFEIYLLLANLRRNSQKQT